MRRRLPWLLTGGAGLLIMGVAAAQTPADRLVPLPDGRKLHLICAGTGTPTVILEGGWGATALSWGKIQAGIAPKTTVCAYDRAGTGTSDPGPLPRSATAIADDLAALIAAAKLRPPFVIAAHSLGALPARILAARPGSGVEALLLIDPTVEYQPQRMGGGADAFAPLIARARAAGKPDQASELEVLAGLSSDQVAQAGPMNVPVVVLTAGNSQPNPEAQTRWSTLHAALGGRQEMIAGASHMLPRDHPEIVTQAILSLIGSLPPTPSPRP